MKKSLLAVAAIGAFASAAQAQSSVTVYGILDVGYIGSNTRGVATANNTPAVTDSVTKQNTNAFGNSAESTSRLGFKGNEDLGGGKSAFFTLEYELDPNTTAVNSSTRQAFAGLKSNGLGQAAFGTQYTPIHVAVAQTDAGQQNNMVGNLIYATNIAGGVGNGGTAINTLSGTTNAYTVRTSNTLNVQSDVFAGFKATGMYTMNNQNTTQTTPASGSIVGGNNNFSGWGLGLDYSWKKLLVTANYQALKSLQSAQAQPIVTTTDSPWTTTTGGVNSQDNQAYIAATYDFGILKAYAQWVSRKATATQTSNVYVKRTAQQIGVRSQLTPTIDAFASIGNGRYTAFGQGTPTSNLVGWQLGSNYYLSKRTNLYAIYGQAQSSNVAQTAGGQTYSYGSNNYAIGVRHTF